MTKTDRQNYMRGLAALSPGGVWAVRCLVLLALVMTLWFFGPRAARVAAARIAEAPSRGPEVDLERVGFGVVPEWLRGPLLVAVAADLEPVLTGRLPIMDEPGALRLQERLAAVSWVDLVRIERRFPDRFRVQLELRRPVLVIVDAQGLPVACADAGGVCLPPVEGLELPRMRGRPRRGTARATPGERHPDPRVRAAAAVAIEWRDVLAPRVPDCPRLLAVDTSNLEQGFLVHPRYPEVQVEVARRDGAPVVLAYGRPPGSDRSRVSVDVKAEVLSNILAKYPGLIGLERGDLRFSVRWRDWLLPREGPDPVGPWADPSSRADPPGPPQRRGGR